MSNNYSALRLYYMRVAQEMTLSLKSIRHYEWLMGREADQSPEVVKLLTMADLCGKRIAVRQEMGLV